MSKGDGKLDWEPIVSEVAEIAKKEPVELPPLYIQLLDTKLRRAFELIEYQHTTLMQLLLKTAEQMHRIAERQAELMDYLEERKSNIIIPKGH